MAVQAAIPALGKSMSLRPSWATQEAGASLDYAARPCIKKEKKREVLRCWGQGRKGRGEKEEGRQEEEGRKGGGRHRKGGKRKFPKMN